MCEDYSKYEQISLLHFPFLSHHQLSPQLTTSQTELPQSQNKSYEPLGTSQNTPLQLGTNCFYIPHSMP